MHHRPRTSPSSGQDYYFADLCSVSAIPRTAGLPTGFCKTTPVSRHYIAHQKLWVPSPFFPPKNIKCFFWEADNYWRQGLTYSWTEGNQNCQNWWRTKAGLQHRAVAGQPPASVWLLVQLLLLRGIVPSCSSLQRRQPYGELLKQFKKYYL